MYLTDQQKSCPDVSIRVKIIVLSQVDQAIVSGNFISHYAVLSLWAPVARIMVLLPCNAVSIMLFKVKVSYRSNCYNLPSK